MIEPFMNHNVAITITGAIRGTSSEKRFQELGLEFLKSGRWLRKLYLFYKIFHENSPLYLFKLILPNRNICLCYKKFSKKQNLEF